MQMPDAYKDTKASTRDLPTFTTVLVVLVRVPHRQVRISSQLYSCSPSTTRDRESIRTSGARGVQTWWSSSSGVSLPPTLALLTRLTLAEKAGWQQLVYRLLTSLPARPLSPLSPFIPGIPSTPCNTSTPWLSRNK